MLEELFESKEDARISHGEVIWENIRRFAGA